MRCRSDNRSPAKTRELFHDGWLDTGDRGYMAGGNLFATGRIKDIFIRAGQHIAPHEIEEAVGAVPASAPRGRDRPLLTKERTADRFILMIDDLAIARAIHVLGIVHWIGGVAAVTMVVLPHAQVLPDANAAIAAFEAFERRFARQARISVTLTGVSGIYILWRLAAWERFESPSFWWLHLMVALWILFVLMLFVLEPLGIDRLFRSYALREKDHAFTLATRLHWAALIVAALTIVAGVLGAHGYLS